MRKPKIQLSPELIDEIIRLIHNGLFAAEVADAVGVSVKCVYAVSARYQLHIKSKAQFRQVNQKQPAEICPTPNELIHVSGGNCYPGFDLLPADAERLREVRQGIYYSLHPECEAIDRTTF